MIDIWSFTWPDLYTRLVTYARLHILRLVVSFYHDTSYISFITLFLTLVILLSFILVIMWLLLILLLCTSIFPLHTLIRSLLTTLNSHVQVLDTFLYCSGVRVLVRFARSWSFSLLVLVFFCSLLSSCYFLILDRYQIQSLFQFFLYDIMRGCLYVILQWLLIYYG